MAYVSVKATADANSYQSTMKSMAQEAKALASQWTATQAKAKAFGSETDILKSKAGALSDKIKLQREIVKVTGDQYGTLSAKLTEQKNKHEDLKSKVETTKKAYEESAQATGANSDESKKLKEELTRLEGELRASETSIGKTESALNRQAIAANNAEAKLTEMESELKGTEQELEKLNKELQDQKLDAFASGCDNVGSKLESFGKKMAVVSAGVVALGAGAIKSFVELDEGYDTIVTKTGATGEALEGLNQVANNIFGTLPEDMSVVGEAVGEVNTRFHSTGDELESLSTQFIQFANINGTEVTKSVDTVDKIMQAWNIDSKETGNLLGLLTAKAQATGISVDTLEGYVLENNATFKEMGLSLEQSIELMAQFDENGVDSTQALAGLKKALQNATESGMTMDEALSKTIGSIKNAKTDTEALQIATDLFGKKGAAEMSTAIREGRIDLDNLSKSMSEYGTIVTDTYNGTLDPIDNAKVATNNIKLALSELASTAQTAAAPIIQELTDKIKDITSWFTSLNEGQQQTIIKMGLFAGAVSPAAMVVGKLGQGVKSAVNTYKSMRDIAMEIIPKITAKAAAMTADTTATVASTAASVKNAAASAASTVKTIAMTAASKAAAAGQWLLNAAMSANPIAIVVLAIAGLVAGFVALYKNSETFRNAVNQLWSTIKDAFGKITETISNTFGKVKEAVSKGWDNVKAATSEKLSAVKETVSSGFNAAKETMGTVLDAAKSTVQEKLNNIKAAYEENGGGIKGVVAGSWEGVKGYYTAGFTFLDTLSGGKLSEIKNVFSDKLGQCKSVVAEKFNGIKADATNAWTNTKNTISSTTNAIKSNASNTFNSVKTTTANVFNAIKSNATTAWNSIKTAVTTPINAAKNTVSSTVNGIKSTVSSTFNSVKSTASSTWNSIKTAVTTPINAAKNTVSSTVNGIKSTVSSVFNSVKSTAQSTWNSIKTAITTPINSAKSAVQTAIDAMKRAFNFSWSLPKLKLPHVSIRGSFSLDPPSVPKFGIEWYKTGGIMTSPTVFGMMGNTLLAGGEAGAEAILPLESFYTRLNFILDKKLEAIKQETNVNVEVRTYIDSDEVANHTVSKVDAKMVQNKRQRR